MKTETFDDSIDYSSQFKLTKVTTGIEVSNAVNPVEPVNLFLIVGRPMNSYVSSIVIVASLTTPLPFPSDTVDYVPFTLALIPCSEVPITI